MKRLLFLLLLCPLALAMGPSETLSGTFRGPGVVVIEPAPVAGPVTVTLSVALRENFAATYATVPGGTATAACVSVGECSMVGPDVPPVALSPATDWAIDIDMGVPGPVSGVYFGLPETVSWVDPDGFQPGDQLLFSTGIVMSMWGGNNLKAMSVDSPYEWTVTIE